MKVVMHGKTIELRLSAAASKALDRRNTPLRVEMELLFSCLIRKRVHFSDLGAQAAIPASEQLFVHFRPVMTQVCSVHGTQGGAPVKDFPIAKPAPYVPRWLAIDYRNGRWQGQFGY
ncbi:MAG: hypothetical protein M0037_02125 [Betaproteobacteria bacterium]|nr:hypothetical protein [Betaproteobacteria bacterium]